MATAKGTLQEAFGRVNPALKMPVELASGTSFFSGRDLEDLDPQVGRIAANLKGEGHAKNIIGQLPEQALANSRLARYMSTARQLSDPRKQKSPLKLGINLLTGARVTDVDQEKTRNIAIREGVEEMLRGTGDVRKFESLYLPEGSDPDERTQKLMSLRNELTREHQRKARAAARNTDPMRQLELELARSLGR